MVIALGGVVRRPVPDQVVRGHDQGAPLDVALVAHLVVRPTSPVLREVPPGNRGRLLDHVPRPSRASPSRFGPFGRDLEQGSGAGVFAGLARATDDRPGFVEVTRVLADTSAYLALFSRARGASTAISGGGGDRPFACCSLPRSPMPGRRPGSGEGAGFGVAFELAFKLARLLFDVPGAFGVDVVEERRQGRARRHGFGFFHQRGEARLEVPA